MKKLLTFAILSAAAVSAQAQQLEPGEWEFTTTVTSPAFPKPQQHTLKQCVKKEEAGDPSKWASGGQKSDCKVTPGATSGGSTSWEMSCPSSGMKGKGTVKISGSNMESTLQMSGDMKGQKFEMQSTTTGRRLGACKG